MKKLKWTTRILALVVLLFALPFYFGYGNPLPFLNPNYTLHDNLWLTIFPFILIGLALGWKNEKVGGYLIIIPLLVGILASILITDVGFAVHMFVPYGIGILYLIVGYKDKTEPKKQSVDKKGTKTKKK